MHNDIEQKISGIRSPSIEGLKTLLDDTRIIMDDLRLKYDALKCQVDTLEMRLQDIRNSSGAAIEDDIKSVLRLVQTHRHDPFLGMPVISLLDIEKI